ncbi:MAG TPA: glycosyltransferase [Candidatus Hydrogenedentes bacterium]|nr:glycosyltransferase [Candidatus Hydrogenedentota bacterium]
MKVVLFGNAPEKIAAIRYRVVAFAERLRAEGHTCIICLPTSTPFRERWYENQPRWRKLVYFTAVLLNRIAQLRHVPGADALFFRGPLFDYGPPILERIIHFLNPRMVFDIDDAIWEPPAHVSSPFLRWVDFGWVRKMAGMCQHAIVGNTYLESYVRQYLNHITIVPTCIDMDKHTPKSYAESTSRPVVLGWTGLKDNLGYMEIIQDALRALSQKYDLVVSVASGADYALDGVHIENHRWRMEDEINYLKDADIGLMPLKDTPRARGKCSFKALQYMGVGTPVVLSPVGMNAEVVQDGVDGFLAGTQEEWREKLEKLITDPALRRRMGEAAREAVKTRYSHDANYPAWKSAIEQTAQYKR